jgi:hypothetical protein
MDLAYNQRQLPPGRRIGIGRQGASFAVKLLSIYMDIRQREEHRENQKRSAVQEEVVAPHYHDINLGTFLRDQT